jgi:hypothetical protein
VTLLLPAEDLAGRVAEGIAGMPAVHGLFPASVAAAAASVLLGATGGAPTTLVDVRERHGAVSVSVRLSIDLAASSGDVVLAVRRLVADLLGERPFALHVQIAHID